MVLGDYRPSDSDEALALERLCAQGGHVRLSFHRSTFHRRAENFAEHRILTARAAGQLVGVNAAAVKRASIGGRPVAAGFGFDLRVHPRWRGCGVGRRLFEVACGWALSRAELAYTFTVAGNRPARGLVGQYGVDVGGYAYLAYPAFRVRPVATAPSEVDAREVHAEMLRTAAPFDLAFDPFDEDRCSEVVGAWLLRRGRAVAGCSAWSNRAILAEVVERIPRWARLVRHVQDRLPPGALGLPTLPAPGEELRSWYLFDFFATDPAAARDLVRHVAATAMARGVAWCHLPFVEGDDWIRAVRGDVPRLIAPVLRYRMLVRRADGARPEPIRRPYVDVRDL